MAPCVGAVLRYNNPKRREAAIFWGDKMDETLKYPSTKHVEGSSLQLGDEKSRLPLKKMSGAFSIWEEKLDGANSAIRFDLAGRLILQSRGHVLAGGGREGQFAPLKAWAAAHRDELWELLGSRYMLYGETVYAYTLMQLYRHALI